MIKEAIEKILELGKVEEFKIGDREYTSKPIFPVVGPTPKVLNVDTLTGFTDYISANIDRLSVPADLLIHVKDHNLVELISHLSDDFKQRDHYVAASRELAGFPFGNFMDVESFIIRMQSMFVQDEATAAILKIVGNVGDGVVRNFKDDGVTQEATVKTGVSRVENIPVPNPVELAPYRTFLEIEQPKSKFVFRMRSGQEAPTCALFEADGGTWKNEAIIRIRDWLKNKVKGIAVIA